jgi:hypothetical protein
MSDSKYRRMAHESEGIKAECPECHGTGKIDTPEFAGRCMHCDGVGTVVVVLTRDDKIKLGQLSTRDDAGRHFTETHNAAWLARLEQIGLITIDRPVHAATGIAYDQQYWSVEVAPEVAEWFDEQGELIEN